MNSSALEHSVPEQLFSTPENKAEAVSAVKAIQLAAAQGIPIYTITAENAATVIPQLELDAAVINEIFNAVNSGKVVTVSKTDINFHGWTGCGYIITDSTTGAGAYMISGGESGGHLFTAYASFAILFVSLIAILTPLFIFAGPFAFLAAVAVASIITEILMLKFISSIDDTLHSTPDEYLESALSAKTLMTAGMNMIPLLSVGFALVELAISELMGMFTSAFD